MKAIVLVDNNLPAESAGETELRPEWGLSVYIEHEGQRILLDTGKSGNFARNAKCLGVDLEAVDFGVLSHAHYDHADGMADFFEINKKADFYLREGTRENCYGRKRYFGKYIGICKGYLENYKDRIVYASGKAEIAQGVTLLPHSTVGLQKIGRYSKLYVKRGGLIRSDDFKHEQSLVIEEKEGLWIFSSCSHGGACNIIREVEKAFPGKKIYAMVGGLHLFRLGEAEVRRIACEIKQMGVEKIYTGHCTGDGALAVLKEELGDRVEAIFTGMCIEN